MFNRKFRFGTATAALVLAVAGMGLAYTVSSLAPSAIAATAAEKAEGRRDLESVCPRDVIVLCVLHPYNEARGLVHRAVNRSKTDGRLDVSSGERVVDT